MFYYLMAGKSYWMNVGERNEGLDTVLKILLGIFSRNDNILQIQASLERLGHEVIPIYTDNYRQICPYYKKKLDKLGVHFFRTRYEAAWRHRLRALLDEFQPDVVLFINFVEYMLEAADLQYIQARAKTIVWFVDSVLGKEDLLKYYPYFDRICVFEERDVRYLEDVGHISAVYVPVGYNAAYENCESQEKELDIVFIGSPFINRLKILEKLAERALEKRWKLEIYGPFYEEGYPWKKYWFREKYPHVFKCLQNGTVTASKSATLYSKTKICLNIHDDRHKSPNPRTFEILATGAFELIDERESYGGLLQEGRDLIQFRDLEDLLLKIDYYLLHEDEREAIAASGHRTIYGSLDMGSLLVKVLE